MPDRAYKHKPKFSISALKEFGDLFDWLKQISRFNKVEDFIYISDYKKGKIRLKIFTKDHEYNISAHLPQGDRNGADSGYLSCIANSRKPRAGEDWNRGNDLADGGYGEKTWQEIKDNILAYELVKVVRNSPDKEPRGRAIEAVIEKEAELLEMLKGHLGGLKQNDELGFEWGGKHFVVKVGVFGD